jgi:hypothetical protein
VPIRYVTIGLYSISLTICYNSLYIDSNRLHSLANITYVDLVLILQDTFTYGNVYVAR